MISGLLAFGMSSKVALKLLQFGRRCQYVYGGIFKGRGMEEILKIKSSQWMSLEVYFPILVLHWSIIINFHGLSFYKFLVSHK